MKERKKLMLSRKLQWLKKLDKIRAEKEKNLLLNENLLQFIFLLVRVNHAIRTCYVGASWNSHVIRGCVCLFFLILIRSFFAVLRWATPELRA